MERGDQALRLCGQGGGRADHEEVDLHRIPLQLPAAHQGHLDGLASHIEAQVVTQLQAQGVHDANLGRDFGSLGMDPAAGSQPVVAGHPVGVGEIEFAVNEALGPIVRIVLRADGAVVDGHQAPPHHRVERHLAQAGLGQHPTDVRLLIGLDVDDEAVGGIGWRSLLPGGQQVIADDGEQQQRHQADGERHDLHGRHGQSPGPACQRQAQHQCPAATGPLGAQACGQPDPAHGQQHEGQASNDKAAQGQQRQAGLTHQPEQQQAKGPQCHDQHHPDGQAGSAQVTTQHAQWRDAGQPQDRDSGKAQHQHHGHQQGLQRRPGRRCGQRGLQHHASHAGERMVSHPAQDDAQGAPGQCQPEHLQHQGPGQQALGQPHGLQDGKAIQVALGKAAGAQADGHGGDQGRQQRDQRQELARTRQRVLDLGAARFQILQMLACTQAGLQPVLEF